MRHWLIFIVCLTGLAAKAGAKERFAVQYVSAENVYLDGGQADGLAVGARLLVLGQPGSKAEIEVVYVAAHSASCKVISATGDIQVGDVVQVKEIPKIDTAAVADTSKPAVTPVAPVQKPLPPPVKRTQSTVTGSVSLLDYYWNDHTAANLDFNQTTARVSLKARRLWGKEMTLSVRGRGRFDKRRRDYRSDVVRDDWQNRLWEFSLSYEEPSAKINFQAGRILPRGAGTIGYLDGLLVEGLLSPRVHAGMFGGSYPGWLSEEHGLSLMKGGGFITYATGDYRNLHFEQNLSAVGEYHGGDINREYLVVQGRLSQGSDWGLSHTGEIEINRSWRKSRAGKTFELSNFYLNGWARPTNRVRLSLSYDTRTNYWTFGSRSVVDSLFDDRLRQGVRVQGDLTLPAQWFSSLSAGYRDRSGDPDPTRSYSVQLRKGNLLFQGLSLTGQYAAFHGSVSRGYNYAVRASALIRSRYTLGAAYGSYAYRIEGVQNRRHNNWVEISGQVDLSRRYWLGLLGQSDTGDDMKGYRIQSELGYRF